MSKTIRIAVISDQHIDREAEPSSWKLAKKVYRAASELDVDHVVLAGDTFDCATAMQNDSGAVRKYLKRLGLWTSDRLSIVMGNHDIFHTPHHRRGAALVREVANQALPGVVKDNVESFVDWAGELVEGDEWASKKLWAPYSKQVGHVRLLCASTVANDVRWSGNGHWWPAVDEALRDVLVGADERCVLAIHQAPIKDDWQTITNLAKGEFAYGFAKSEFKSLRNFVRDRGVEAILCGHLHWKSGAKAQWDFGAARVFLQGRSGGMATDPSLGVLTVPLRGAPTWADVDL